MPPPASATEPSFVRCGARLAAFEVVWIFLIFFLFAGSLPPDVGESHYLVKAKHYWQPAWCAGDLFLESRDAHTAFYWTFGWVTKFCSLAATAWIGRVVTWLLLAWSWQRLSWSLVPRPLRSLLSAGLLLLFLRQMHLAGEWVIGGVEAKGFAYVLVFLALEAIVRSRWQTALLLAGAAGTFHVLVGGWTVVAIGLAWLMSGNSRPRLMTLVPAAAVGFLLALPGLIPALALNAGVPKDVAREAERIYVFERLAHHLVYSQFPAVNIARFQVLVIAWAALAWLQRSEPTATRLQRVVAGTVVIALVGVLIDQAFVIRANLLDQSAEAYETSAAGLLRYYWYRMSDSLIPAGVALALVVGLTKLQATKPLLANWLTMAVILLASANLAEVHYQRRQQPVPPAIIQPQPTVDSRHTPGLPPRAESAQPITAQQWFEHWRSVCNWISRETPGDALFLTPREQQTFKWYAGRAEIVTRKDVPQDARGLIEWKRRLEEVYPRDQAHQARDLAAFSDVELTSLARKYKAAYILVDRSRSRRRIGLPQVYPLLAEENPSFAVYRVPEPATP